MISSIEQSEKLKVDQNDQFGVLNSQLESGARKVPITIKGFEGMPKPTDLDLDNILKVEPGAPEKKETENKSEPVETKEKFLVPQPLLDYLDNLIINGRKLTVLKFDIAESISVDQIKKILSDKLSDTSINEEENSDMLNLLEGKSIIAREEKTEKSAEVIHLDLETVRQEYLDNLVPYLENIRVNRPKFEKTMDELGANKHMPLIDESKELKDGRELYFKALKSKIQSESKGIVSAMKIEEEELSLTMSKILEAMNQTEKNIAGKAFRVWESRNPDSLKKIGIMLMDSGVLKFSKEVEPPSYEGFRMKDMPEEIPPEKEVIVEKPTITPEQTPVDINFTKTETEIESLKTESPEQPKNNQFVFPLEFEGRKVEVVRGEIDGSNKNIIKVSLDGREIAKGLITDKGSEVKLNPDLKGGFLLAKTDYERAFGLAEPLIKTFKPIK